METQAPSRAAWSRSTSPQRDPSPGRRTKRGQLERQALCRGDFAGVEKLVRAIRRFRDGWNQRCQPFTWTKDADQILAKLNRQNTPATDH